MKHVLFGLTSLTLLLTACGDKEEDTATDTDTDVTDTDVTDTDTDVTDTDTDTDTIVDADMDGFAADVDCNDDDASIHPEAEDTIGDGVDNNCDGIDGLDTDRDGHASVASGGDDCDDTDPNRNPSTPEIENDGIDQNCSVLQLHLDLTCSSGSTVRLTGPWWNWDPNGGPQATDTDGDGIHTVEFEEPLSESMEYKWIVDGEFEADLVNAGFCADYTNPSVPYANRIWIPGDGNTTEYPGTCFACGQTDWSAQSPTIIDLFTDATAMDARIIGPWWGWDPNSGPVGSKIADGHFQFTFDPAPSDNMEFIFYVDGTPEALVGQSGITCNAINTDYANYFNRYWLVGSGNQSYEFNSCTLQ